MRGSALAGFQLAMRAGSLCEEPVRGVAVILESAGGGECTIFKIFKISVRDVQFDEGSSSEMEFEEDADTLLSMIQMFILLLDLLMEQLRRRS
jgi:hypothetical protein